MSLLVDKYRPSTLDSLDYHPQLSNYLRNLVRLEYFIIQANGGDLPHLLVVGPSGAGKKTRIMATLSHLFGPGVEKVFFNF